METRHFFDEKEILQRNEERKKHRAEHLGGKKNPARQVVRKGKSPQELNGRPLEFLCGRHFGQHDQCKPNTAVSRKVV